MEHKLWLTAVLNKLLAGVVTPLLTALRLPPPDPAYPIPDYLAMELLVVAAIITLALIVRSRLSVENPGILQHIVEEIVKFTQDTAEEIIGHGSERYVPMLATLFIFVLVCNLLTLVPALGVPNSALQIEVSPTGWIQATLGLAVAAFLYYNFHGLRHHGVAGYLKHLCGPMLGLAILMFPIEVVGNFGRLLSLSVRLYANMLVGGILERIFGGLVPILVPVVFMALHMFVSLLQAYIFMLLPAIYISMAVAEEH
ncbi:MAG: ATP synthase F0 subunit A [Acidobacteria bacterium]|nr:MAG: ATP synthase F0 subunit A [Acidobacteriota bacterium]